MRRVLAAVLAPLVVLGGYLALDIADLAPGILTLDPPRQAPAPTSTGPAPAGPAPAGPGPTGTAPTVTSAPVPVPSALAGADPAAVPLATPALTAPVPTTATLAAALAAAVRDRGLGASVGLTVRDAATGAHLYDVQADVPRVPASTTKLLTAAAVSSTLDPTAPLVTRAVQGATPQDVVLVAGGDTLLSPGKGNKAAVVGRAGLADLAAATASALKARGVTVIRLELDESAAAGPAYGPGWARADIAFGLTGPVAMIGLSTQRSAPGRRGSATPGLGTASAFRAALVAQGMTVAPNVARARAAPTAPELAAVRSAPVGDVLAYALDESDNALTESLARRAAAQAGTQTTFPAVAAWVLSKVTSLGIDTTGVRLVDSSGLSRGTVIPPRVLGDVLTLAAGGTAPAVQTVVSRLPVAGLTGTLQDRFVTGPARAAAGIARAKTGTLTGVSALAGTLVDRDGRLLVFAVLADKVPPGVGTLTARSALDRFVATLAACGCHGHRPTTEEATR